MPARRTSCCIALNQVDLLVSEGSYRCDSIQQPVAPRHYFSPQDLARFAVLEQTRTALQQQLDGALQESEPVAS